MARRIAALVGLVVTVTLAPVALAHFGGMPALDRLPDLRGIQRAIDLRWVPLEWGLALLALVGWILWLYLLVAVILRIAGHVDLRLRGGGRVWRTSEVVTWAPLKVMVDVALGAVLLASTVGNLPAGAASSTRGDKWASAIGPQVAAVRSEGTPARAAVPQKKDPTQPPRPDAPTGAEARDLYVVRPGDSLWSIAEEQLGDPYRWVDLWELNTKRDVGDGHRLTKPGFIRPGWTLRLPATPSTEAVDRPNPGTHAQEERRPTQPDQARPGRDCSTSEAVAVPTPSPSPSVTPALHPDHDERVELPSGTAVTVGFVAGVLSTLGLSELLRRRRRQPQPPSAGWPGARRVFSLKNRLLAAVSDRLPSPGPSGPLSPLLSIKSPPNEIVLGHRNGAPVVAAERGRLYSFGGERTEVERYLRDVALHAVLSHRARVEVWATQELELSGLPTVRRFGDPRALVSDLEIEILRRHRMFDEEGVGDWEQHEGEWNDDSLSIVLSMSPAGDLTLENRLRAVATQGHDLGIVVMILGAQDPAFEVSGDLVVPTDPSAAIGEDPFEPLRVADADREALLRELEDGRDGAPVASAPVQSAPDRPTEDPRHAFRIRLFGRPVIEGADDGAADGFGPKGRELLFLFLLNPDGLTRDEAIEMLWPEVDPEKGVQRFKFQLQKVRSHLRNDRIPTAKIIEKVGDVLRPQPELFDVDVWEFDRLLESASVDGAEATLAAAADLCRGDLLQGLYFEWADPLKAHFRERLLDVLVRLSDLRAERSDHEGALEAVRRAIAVDPFAEHLYRRAMTLYAHLGRTSDVHRTYSELEALLADELEAEPDPETSDLKDRLSSPAGRLGGR